MLIIGDRNNKSLSEKLGAALGAAVEYPEVHIFPDGERRIRVSENVKGKEVLLVRSFSHPVEENLFEFCFIADALKKIGAKEIIAVIPYLAYERADHLFRTGEAVPLEVVIKIIETLKLTKIIIFDPHSIKTPEIFSIPVVSLSAIPIFAKKIEELAFDKNNLTIVSPDMGGVRRAELLAKKLGEVEVAFIEKERDLETGKVEATSIKGKVNKVCLILDDIIASGGTIAKAAEFLKNYGTEKVYCFATHPVLAPGAAELLAESNLEAIFVTDSLPITPEKRIEKLEILSVAEEIKKSIK